MLKTNLLGRQRLSLHASSLSWKVFKYCCYYPEHQPDPHIAKQAKVVVTVVLILSVWKSQGTSCVHLQSLPSASRHTQSCTSYDQAQQQHKDWSNMQTHVCRPSKFPPSPLQRLRRCSKYIKYCEDLDGGLCVTECWGLDFKGRGRGEGRGMHRLHAELAQEACGPLPGVLPPLVQLAPPAPPPTVRPRVYTAWAISTVKVHHNLGRP